MTLAAPWALLGLGACAGPLILHWIGRARPKRVRWALMSILEETVCEQRRPTRIKDVIQLLLRTLLIAAVVLAVAQPTLNVTPGSLWSGFAQTRIAIAVDVSCSMRAREGGSTRFERARTVVEAVAARCRAAGQQVALVRFDSTSRLLAELGDDAGFARALGEMECGYGASDYVTALRSMLAEFKRTGAEPHAIVLLSDRQATGLRESSIAAAEAFEVQLRHSPVHLVSVASPSAPNVAIDSLTCPPDGYAVAGGAPLVLNAIVANHGPACSRRIRWRIEDEETSHLIDLQAFDEVIERAPPHRFERAGSHIIEVSVEAAGNDAVEDRLAADDRRQLLVRALERVPVRIAGDGGEFVGAFLAAWQPDAGAAATSDGDNPPAPSDEVRPLFAPRKFSAAELTAVLRSARYSSAPGIVVLAGLTQMDDELGDALATFVHGGGGLLVAPGPGVDPAVYTRVLGSRDLLPASFDAPSGPEFSAIAADEGLQIATRNLRHPIAAPIGPPDLWRHALSAARFTRTVALQQPLAQGAQVVLSLTNGQPFLVARRSGAGAVLFMASALDDSWSNLPGTYTLLVVDRALRWLTGLTATMPSERIGEGLDLGAARSARLKSPDGRELEVVESLSVTGERMLSFGPFDVPGVFELEILESDSDVGVGVPLRRVVVGLDPDESDLATVPISDPGRWPSWLHPVDVTFGAAGSDDALRPALEELPAFATGNVIPLAGALFVVAMLLFVLEALFARFRVDSTDGVSHG